MALATKAGVATGKESAPPSRAPQAGPAFSVGHAASGSGAFLAAAGNLAAQRAFSSAGPPAVTQDGNTTFHPALENHPRRGEIAAHEAVHRAQFAARELPQGSREQLERDARQGARALLGGRSYTPGFSAPPNTVLGFDTVPLMPEVESSGRSEAESLSALGPEATRAATVRVGVAREGPGLAGAGPGGGGETIRYRSEVAGAGSRGAVNTATDLSVTYTPGTPFGTAAGPAILVSPELGLAPPVPVPLYPVVLSYDRRLRCTDADGRDVTVNISARVNFTHLSWARAIAGRPPTFETLLSLRGDSSHISVLINGTGPLQPYYADYYNSGSSLNIQSMIAESALQAGAGLLPFTSRAPARFVRPELSAGAQFESLEAFLVSADAVELARRAEMERRRRAALGWFGRFLEDTGIGAALSRMGAEIAALWNSLPAPVRGILVAIGKFIVGLAVILGIAGLIVLAAPEVAFGTAVLIVAAIAFGVVFLVSGVTRTIEALGAGVYDPGLILGVALLDTVGVSAVIEAFTDTSIISGEPLRRSIQDRWEAGTTGVLQIIATILAVRGAMRAGPPPPSAGEPPPDLIVREGALVVVREPAGEPVRPVEPAPGEPAPPAARARAPYSPRARTDAELILDRDAMPRPGETPAEGMARARAAAEETRWREFQGAYNALGDRPPRINIRANDGAHGGDGAHTLLHHGPDVPLRRAGAPAGARTIEGRIYGDPPWHAPENWSFRWQDEPTMNRTINDYLRANWERIRWELADTGRFEVTFDADHAIGEGFYNRGMAGVGPRAAVYHRTSYVTLTLVLIPGDPPSFFVVRAFPAGRGLR